MLINYTSIRLLLGGIRYKMRETTIGYCKGTVRTSTFYKSGIMENCQRNKAPLPNDDRSALVTEAAAPCKMPGRFQVAAFRAWTTAPRRPPSSFPVPCDLST